MDELNELTDKLSSVDITSDENGIIKQQNDNNENIFVMKSLRDVISKIQI
jgi:hypothetical protein